MDHDWEDRPGEQLCESTSVWGKSTDGYSPNHHDYYNSLAFGDDDHVKSHQAVSDASRVCCLATCAIQNQQQETHLLEGNNLSGQFLSAAHFSIYV